MTKYGIGMTTGQSTTLEVTFTTPTIKGSTLAACKATSSQSDVWQKKGRPWCEHCRRMGHIKDTCWKVHSKPANWKPNCSTPNSREQLEMLQKPFSQQNPIGMASLAQKRIFQNGLTVKMETPKLLDCGLKCLRSHDWGWKSIPHLQSMSGELDNQNCWWVFVQGDEYRLYKSHEELNSWLCTFGSQTGLQFTFYQ